MPITLPRAFRGFRYQRAVPFEMNDALIESMLPSLFQRVVLGNRDIAKANLDPSDITGPATKLANAPRLVGFHGEAGEDLLNKIMRSSLVTIGYKGTRRREQDKQLDGIVPYSLASFKVGLPRSRTRLRGIDQFLYDLLRTEFKERGGDEEVRRVFAEIFGKGVKITPYPTPAAARDSRADADLDILTELSITLLEVGFNAVTPKQKQNEPWIPQPLPAFQKRFGNHLYRFLWSYKDPVPTTLLIDQVVTLVAFELTIFSIRLLYALPELRGHPSTIPALMGQHDTDAAPDIYLDMIGSRRSLSRTMAAGCVRRDMAQIDPFMRSVFLLRYLDATFERLRTNPQLTDLVKKHLDRATTPEYLQALLLAEDGSRLANRLEDRMTDHIEEIKAANRAKDEETGEETLDADTERLFDTMRDNHVPLFEQMEEVLYLTQAGKTRSNVLGWIASVGGAGKPFGLINAPSDRRSWSYAPTNDLLSVLIQLRAIDYKGWNPSKGAEPRGFGLREFLDWLQLSFGIVIDRPPADLGFDSPEHMAAARENLQAMLRRLRQMGIFEDRSDDFTVQQLTPPFMDIDLRDDGVSDRLHTPAESGARTS